MRTVIGGAQIIDMVCWTASVSAQFSHHSSPGVQMILVVDVMKGIQAQTAEVRRTKHQTNSLCIPILLQCLILGEITTRTLVVALNKTDLLPGSGPEDPVWQAALQTATLKVKKVLSKTAFADAPLVPLSAAPGGAGKTGAAGDTAVTAVGDVSTFAHTLLSHMPLPRRGAASKPFVFAVDHCFSVKGHGTVLTGTAISGSASTGDMLELPAVGCSGKLKSAQVFHKSVSVVRQGDRAGLCVPGVPADSIERGLLCTPGAVKSASTLVALVRKVRYFKEPMPSQSKCHISIGHNTVVGTVSFAGAAELAAIGVTSATAQQVCAVPAGCTYAAQEALVGKRPGLQGKPPPGDDGAAWQWAVVQLDSPVLVPEHSIVIGSRLDTEAASATCRLAWFGRVLAQTQRDPGEESERSLGGVLHVYRNKFRTGEVDRVNKAPSRGVSLIGKNLFHKETDMSNFTGMQVVLQLPTASQSAGSAAVASTPPNSSSSPPSSTAAAQAFVVGTLQGAFGKSGKFKAEFTGPVYMGQPSTPWAAARELGPQETAEVVQGGSSWEDAVCPGLPIILPFRKRLFVHAETPARGGGGKQMLQGGLTLPTWEQLTGITAGAAAGAAGGTG